MNWEYVGMAVIVLAVVFGLGYVAGNFDGKSAAKADLAGWKATARYWENEFYTLVDKIGGMF